MSSDLPALAHPHLDGVVLEIRRRRLPVAVQRALAVGGFVLLFFGFPWYAALALWAAAAAVRFSRPRPALIRLGPGGVELDGRPVPVPTPELRPERWLQLAELSVGDAVVAGVDLTPREAGWLVQAIDATTAGRPLPPWRAPEPEPWEIGQVGPGEQTIELDGAPVTPAVALVGLAALILAVTLGVAMGATHAFVVLVIASLAAVRWWPGSKATTLQIRQHGLTLTHGGRRVALAYADLVQVRAERRSVYSELVLVYRDGTEERVPVRGMQVARAVARAISHAAGSTEQHHEDPEARRALEDLRA